MTHEREPRKNCSGCGATVCFDQVCAPENIARAEAFIALGPSAFFTKPIPRTHGARVTLLGVWAKAYLSPAWLDIYLVLCAATRKHPRVEYAFASGDFRGWPELDAAYRLGGFEAVLDVAAEMIRGLPPDDAQGVRREARA